MARLAAILAVAFAALWLATAPALAQSAPHFPPLTGRVVDQADLLSPATEAALTSKLAALEQTTTDQVVVATVPDLQGREIEEYGYQLGRAWGIGQSGKNNGVVLLIARDERRVRIEVGYGLEPVLTDALSALIIHDEILPALRDGDFDRGVTDGVDAIDAQLRLDPAEAQARAATAERPRSGAPIGPAILIVVVFLFLALGLIGSIGGRGRRRRGNGVAPVLIWAASEALRNSSRGGRGGGGGWSGGGGFGGGGGSFGGGGASGGW
ncbi:TPM domain-containing protein [Brevundimonas sp. GCM10030266]|uniref:TPM domain-containing protein n=1 Tax=Brevundimonas sp. GCM10030266 TaxID=3273386 RepID=UPI003620E78E